MYLLPAIDILEGKAVRLAKGDYRQVTVYNDDPAAQAQLFEEQGATWLHVVDLDGARTGVPENVDIIDRILAKTLLKVEVGGGIRSLDTIQRLYDAGVSRVVLGTGLVADPDFAEAAVARFGGLLAAGIDARGGEVAVSGWREGSGMAADDLVRSVAERGFRHLVYTDIARDGMRTGIDETAYEHMAVMFGREVTASGGVAGLDDIRRLGRIAGHVEGIIAGRAVYEGSFSVEEGVRVCEEATRAADLARVVADPCGMGGARC